MAEWIKLQADDFEATVPVQSLLAFNASYIGTMVEFELKKGLPNPAVRLNCSAEEAREVVALLRQGKHYEPPRDNPRLMSALSRTLDFLGLPGLVGAASNSQEVLLVPTYVIGSEHIPPDATDSDFGLLMYSAGSQGWANKKGDADPRPEHVLSTPFFGTPGRPWLASVLPTEATGAGEDLIYMIPNAVDHETPDGSSETPVLLRASLKTGAFAQPPEHLYAEGTAMTAAGGKLYVFGGLLGVHPVEWGSEQAVPNPSTLEVFDPHLDTWFTASSPLPERSCLVDHAMVSNKPGGMLLVIGGRLTNRNARNGPPPAGAQWDGLALYDINAGKWSSKPESKFPAAGMQQGSVSAIVLGDSTVMVISKAYDPPAAPAGLAAALQTDAAPARADLLDLRMMRWRAAAPLQRPYLHGVSLVEYDGKVMAVGGARLPYHHIGEYSCSSSQVVSVYDERNDSWSDMPAKLPFSISYSTPVVVRAPSTLQWLQQLF